MITRLVLPTAMLLLVSPLGAQQPPAKRSGASSRARLKRITQVLPGTGLTGGGTGPSVTLGVKPGGITGNEIEAGTIGTQHLTTDAIAALRGNAGPQGPAGPQGVAGPQGPKGDQGTVGPAGPQGASGPQGLTGPRGATGSTGVTGATGAMGIQGVAGPQGPKGDPGAMGAAGAQGVKGDTGAQGPQGDQGPQGTMGAMGLQGVKGDTGAMGQMGTTGTMGTMGLQGVKGDTGAMGVKGDTGPKGDTGAMGTPGVTPQSDVYNVTLTNPVTLSDGVSTTLTDLTTTVTLTQTRVARIAFQVMMGGGGAIQGAGATLYIDGVALANGSLGVPTGGAIPLNRILKLAAGTHTFSVNVASTSSTHSTLVYSNASDTFFDLELQ